MASGEPQKWATGLHSVSAPGFPVLWYQRLISEDRTSLHGTEHSHGFAVCTPDGDVCLEDLSGRVPGNTDLSRNQGQVRCSPSLLEYNVAVLAVSAYVEKQWRKADEKRAFAQENKKAPLKKKKEGE